LHRVDIAAAELIDKCRPLLRLGCVELIDERNRVSRLNHGGSRYGPDNDHNVVAGVHEFNTWFRGERCRTKTAGRKTAAKAGQASLSPTRTWLNNLGRVESHKTGSRETVATRHTHWPALPSPCRST